MRQHANAYRKASEIAISPRQTEIAAFQLVVRGLEEATSPDSQPNCRVIALGRAHELWSLLVRDLSSEANLLPPNLRAQLVDLGVWAMRYATLALLHPLDLRPLIDVCRNVLEGLLGQKANQVLPPSRTKLAIGGCLA